MKRFLVFVAGVVAMAGLVLTGGADATSTAPTVSSVSPQHGPVAGDGWLVAINGTNLFNASSVTFTIGASVATSTDVVNRSNNRVIVTLPASPTNNPGAADVQVTANGMTSAINSNDVFHYVLGPVIESVRPVAGSILGGNKVFIVGAGFDSTCTAVSFGTGSGTSVTDVSSSAVTAIAPAVSAPATVPVTVTCSGPAATPADPAAQYSYVLPNPQVTAVRYDVGSLGGGETVTIFGKKFKHGAAVNFGANPSLSVTVVNSGKIRAVAPPSGTTSSIGVDIIVVTSHGPSSAVPQDKYFYSTACPCGTPDPDSP